ncbi:hypothetical protein [Nannocystis bainbridge]|uniref:Uncharacterized protein n=1 Tax=Nannocystis bainbridge TaxID=2995303 RepID=A0ABT5E5T8_9BACT|nr:hypothetical protein [Nannocystis bainbridge]MDC0720167.1 hypothetical protein [Nannocystis bainbridge]
MNAPKKPGTDLSALKARLAKKTDAAPPPPAEPAAPAAAAPAAPKAAPPARPPFKKSAPPTDLPAPGESAPIDIPPPGEVAAPIDIPAPGEVALPPQPVAPEPIAAVPAARKSLEDGTPFGATAVAFDPNAGLIDSGEVQAKGNRGLVILAAGAALAFGVALGWIGHQITSKGEVKAAALKKGGDMYNEANKVSDMRKGISLKIDELQKLVSTDPAKGAEELANLVKTNFEKSPKIDDLFGWQLAGIGPEGIRRTFDLYEEANGLRLDLGYLVNFVAGNGKALTETGGPRLFAVKFKKDGAVLVERGEPMCGEAPCPEGKEGEASGYKVRDAVNQEFSVAARGTDDGQVLPLSADTQVYGYVVGLNPENNAKLVAASLFAKVKARLEEMSKAEGRALKALKSYSDDPNIDGGGPADPGAD